SSPRRRGQPPPHMRGRTRAVRQSRARGVSRKKCPVVRRITARLPLRTRSPHRPDGKGEPMGTTWQYRPGSRHGLLTATWLSALAGAGCSPAGEPAETPPGASEDAGLAVSVGPGAAAALAHATILRPTVHESFTRELPGLGSRVHVYTLINESG